MTASRAHRQNTSGDGYTASMGSPVIAGWIAHVAFWTLLILGAMSGELRERSLGGFLILWLAGRFALPYVPYGDGLFTPFIALLDVVLVFVVLKADVPLT
jgi:hypothetical protein